ncbi:hypothetical protein [Micrococcus lylae]|uniref:hypothetical protein n=1 Tax=Micrococcus lylae TaxID=1273 RepID=UPI000C80660D|nr:hypothetical protein [Micrococcus lylae]WIK81984.1 hypothetical protein CJ228_010410 [Micrococcus lylae]
MTASQSAEAEALSAADGEFLDKTFPDIARAMGAESVRRLRETTCTGALPGDRSAAKNTSWIADAEVAVDSEDTAHKVADHIRTQAKKQGWTLAEDPADVDAEGNFAGSRLLGGKHDGQNMVMTVLLDEDRDGTLIVATVVRGICRDMPDGHEMVRSELDPQYGAVGDGYADTDSLEDFTGQPGPLPASTQTPAPTGPEGASPLERNRPHP